MAERLTLSSERGDDLPRLLAQLERMGVPRRRDEHFPTHGNWVGLRLGWVTGRWLTHILSQADPRLNHVAPWAEQRLPRLRGCTGPRVHPLDVSDARLAAVLAALRDELRGRRFARALTQPRWRVSDLPPERGRLERTTARGDWRVTEDGLFPCGPSTAHRPDVPPVQVMLAALDPLGWPGATDVVPGQRAEDPWSIPAITRVRGRLERQGLLSGGECQTGALETRACVQAGGASSLGPLSARQGPPAGRATYRAPVGTGAPALTPIARVQAPGPRARIAEGGARGEALTAVVAGELSSWTARRRVMRAHQRAQAGERALRARLTKAQAARAARHERRPGQRRVTQRSARQAAVEAMGARDQGPGLRQVRAADPRWARPLRRYGSRPATGRGEQDSRVPTRVDQQAVTTAVRQLGGRGSATHAPAAPLSLPQAVLASRHEDLIERERGRLQGRPVSLTPRSRARDDHATGLIRLLALGLRVLTRLACVVRPRLAAAQTTRPGLSAGNPRRSTPRPTAERLLEAFQEVTLTIIREGRRWRSPLTPLSRVHQCILGLRDLPVAIDTRRCVDSHKPP